MRGVPDYCEGLPALLQAQRDPLPVQCSGHQDDIEGPVSRTGAYNVAEAAHSTEDVSRIIQHLERPRGVRRDVDLDVRSLSGEQESGVPRVAEGVVGIEATIRVPQNG